MSGGLRFEVEKLCGLRSKDEQKAPIKKGIFTLTEVPEKPGGTDLVPREAMFLKILAPLQGAILLWLVPVVFASLQPPATICQPSGLMPTIPSKHLSAVTSHIFPGTSASCTARTSRD